MTILAGDIKLVKSQVMDDVPEGGGAATGTVIVDGVSNSIFNDISELDRAIGRVSLRKVFANVQTANTDGYFGSNIIVSDAPDDPRVSVTLFSTGQTFDVRDDARDRVESYLAPGPEWFGFLLENHIAGQRSIQVFQRPDSDQPEIGKTLLLVQDEGLSTEKAQYVRVTRVSAVLRTYTILGTATDYQALVLTLELSDPLRYDFAGTSPNRDFTRASNKTKIRDTVVADAAVYYGVTPLTSAAATGDLQITASSIYSQLVPNAQTEIPVIDANAAGDMATLIDSANGVLSYNTAASFAPGVSLTLGNPIFPGTLSIAYTGGALTDSGGQLFAGTTAIGTVDYPRGVISFGSTSPTFSGSKTITARPAGAPSRVADTKAISVTAESRSYNYVLTIDPPPAPGTLRVSYRAAGRWYDLRDDASGGLKGADAAYGAGTVSYVSGTIAVTLGALPDVGSKVMYAWGASSEYTNRSGNTVPAPAVKLQASQQGMTPGTLTISWNDGSARSASASTAGAITGDATGTVNYNTGEVNLTPANLPAAGQSYTLDYNFGAPQTDTIGSWASVGDSASFPLGGAVLAGSVSVKVTRTISAWLSSQGQLEQAAYSAREPMQIELRDDGAGNLKWAGASVGSVNYATGDVLVNGTWSVPVFKSQVTQTYSATSSPGVLMWTGFPFVSESRNTMSTVNATGVLDSSVAIIASYRAAGDSGQTDTINTGGIQFDLTPGFSETIIPGSVAFLLGGRQYFDRNGSLYYGLDPATGAATASGSVNYQTGVAALTTWVGGAANTVALQSLLTTMELTPIVTITFRVPVSPVRPGSVQILGTKTAGGSVNSTADETGLFNSGGVVGTIDYETGVVQVRFGAYIVAAGHEAEAWYDAAGVGTDGKIFKPGAVLADTVRFNAVAYSYLPLNADVLGLDPVRLPQDGRVPIFRPGTVVVVGHTATVAPTVVADAQVINCGRTRLSRVRVIGNDGNVIDSGYHFDLDAGTVTFDDVTGYSQPVTVEHRIEDMALVSDVQITGQLGLTRPLTHDYPVPGSNVSSALIAGDLRARVSVQFDQTTWTGVWQDTAIGSPANGTFNAIQYPIVVTNAGAVTERWAVQFVNSTNFQIAGEHVGVIATGNTSAACAPLNPATGQPYFSIPLDGWGLGWAAGNVMRFNTVGAQAPVWVARTVLQGPETVVDDSFTMLIRGDVDRP